MNVLCAIFFVGSVFIVQESHAYCDGGKRAIIPDVIGKSFSQLAGCSMGGSSGKLKLDVFKWAIIYYPASWPQYSGCYARIVYPFQKRDKSPMIYYRRHADPEYFKNIASKAYKEWEMYGTASFPCEKVPVVKITPWGSTRKLFANLVQQTILGIQSMRDYECSSMPPEMRGSIEYTELVKTLNLHRQYNAVIDHLYSYSNSAYFCIDAKKGTYPDSSTCFQPNEPCKKKV